MDHEIFANYKLFKQNNLNNRNSKIKTVIGKNTYNNICRHLCDAIFEYGDFHNTTEYYNFSNSIEIGDFEDGYIFKTIQ